MKESGRNQRIAIVNNARRISSHIGNAGRLRVNELVVISSGMVKRTGCGAGVDSFRKRLAAQCIPFLALWLAGFISRALFRYLMLSFGLAIDARTSQGSS